MSPYRTCAQMEKEWMEKPTSKLVRANGSVCTCTPPSWIWRWWFHVVDGDVWICKHGGKWRWGYSEAERRWIPVAASPKSTDGSLRPL